MKKIYCIYLNVVLIIFSCSTLFAQPTLTFLNTGTQPGDNFMMQNIDMLGVTQGDSGVNVTWDFSSLTITGTSNLNWVDPSTTPYSSSFPNSTIAYNDGSGNYFYYSSTTNEFSNHGVYSSGVTQSYSDPEMLISYPCTYSSSHNDYYQSTFFSGVTWYRTGNISVTANAYGTIILPYGTFTDVIRIKVVENYQDSAYYGGSPDVRYGYSEIYFWYKPGIHLYLMQLVSATYNSSFVSYGVYMDQSSTGVSEYMATEIDYKIYPNPANTFTNICYNINEPSYLRISLTDILGQEIEVLVNEMKQKGSYHEIVNLEGIDKGLYFIRIETDGRSQTSRISISQ